MEKKKPDMQFWKARLNKDSRLHTHTHTRRHCCSCFSLHVCQASFSLVHTLLKSWPLIYCILAPNIAYWPLDCAGQEMQGKKNKKQKKRQSSEKKSENNWQASRLMGTALIIMSSLQVSEPAAFWGEVWLPKKQTKRNSFTGIKKAKKGGRVQREGKNEKML